MSLFPEQVARFRIAVPSQYEAELTRALALAGKVHLEEPFEAKHVLPPYFVDILEGKVTPASLNVEEALSAVRKVFRPGEPLLAKIEERASKLAELQLLRSLAEKLEGLGIQPEAIGRWRYGSFVDLVFVEEEDLASAVADFTKAGALVRRVRLAPRRYALLLIYTQPAASAVEDLKKVYGKPLPLPSWFFDKLESVTARIDEEEARLRREILDLLVDAATILRDALEFEKAARMDVLESSRRAVESVREIVPKLGEKAVEAIAHRLSARALLERGAAAKAVLEARDACSIVDSALERKPIAFKTLRRVVRRLGGDESIYRYVRSYNSLLLIRDVLLKLAPLGREHLLLVCGHPALKGILGAEQLKVYGVSILAEKLSEECYAVALSGPEGVIRSLANKLAAEGEGATVLVAPFTEEGLKKLEGAIEAKLEVERANLVAALVALKLRRTTHRLAELLERAGDEEALRLWRELQELTEEGASPAVPTDTLSLMKSVIASADEVSSGIAEISADVDALSALPPRERSERGASTLEKLQHLVREASFVLRSARQLEVVSRVQSRLREVRVFRNRRVVVVEGFIPSRKKEAFERIIRENVPRVLYFKVVDVPRGEVAPTYIESKGFLKYLQPLTFMRGTPLYWELNPTIFFTALFSLMYGIMFGDIGQGAILALFGAWMLKTRYRILGISEEGAASLGALSLLAGISSIAFGALYGLVVFLKPLGHPVISPIHDVYGIIAVALYFGVAQLLLGMALNVVNLWRAGDRLGALFSGMGGMGIAFYLPGVLVAYRLATSGFDLSTLSHPSLQPLLACMIGSLAAIFAFGLYEAKAAGEKERLMHAVSELIELVIALPANSLSYIRLAAFAMGHEAFGVLAENMSPMFGELPSYVIANLLVLAIEALAVGIQALRLTYYEFSTKFFKGEGIEFAPIVG